MFKPKLYLVTAILGMLALLAGACAQPAPTPTPLPIPTPTPSLIPSPAPRTEEPALYSAEFVIVDTGQNTCYNNSREISCPQLGEPFYGQDAQYQGAQFSYRNNGDGTISFLTKNGVEVVVPKEQGCCGAPVYLGAGDFETGRKLADTNVNAFDDLDYIISDCATCISALKDYKKFLADTPEQTEAYAKFGDRVKDISEFLVDVLKLPASAYRPSAEAKGKKVTWHDPCHLNRYLGIKSQPRQIMKSIPGIEYIEMPDADRCCGMAGAFSIYYYDLSQRIADKKMESIRATGADAVVTSCPGCMIQLIDSTIRHKMPQKVMHIMELLD